MTDLNVPAAIPRERIAPVPIEQEAEWAPKAGPDVFEKRNITCLCRQYTTTTTTTTLAPSEYTNRHNKVAVHIHWPTCKHMRLQVLDKYYHRIPERVINVNGTTFMWDVLGITDRTVLANRPDTVLHDRKEKNCLLIDIATPDDSNVNTKETEQLNKCKDLENEASRMWKVRTKIVPVTVGALGTSKGLDQNLSRHQLSRRPQSY